jgi:hypothetical protein
MDNLAAMDEKIMLMESEILWLQAEVIKTKKKRNTFVPYFVFRTSSLLGSSFIHKYPFQLRRIISVILASTNFLSMLIGRKL